VLAGQFIGQPETGIVAGLGVLGAGIAQPDDQLQRRRWYTALSRGKGAGQVYVQRNGIRVRRLATPVRRRRFFAAMGVMDADYDRVLLGTGGNVIRQLHPIRQLQIGQMNRIAHAQTQLRSTSMNSGKSLGRQAISMSINARLTTPPCCLTPREALIDEVQRHMNPQLAVGAHPQESRCAEWSA
jgi:hypothetical protein